MNALSFLGAVALPAAAVAQPVDSRIPRNEYAAIQPEELREVRLIGTRYGDCVVKKQPAAAVSYVLSAGGDSEKRTPARLLERISDGPCLIEAAREFDGIQMTFPGNALRYTLAEALFRAQPPAKPLVIPASLPELDHGSYDQSDYLAATAKNPNSRRAQELAKDRAKVIGAIFLSSFGECVVRANPAGSFALLGSATLSPYEDSAMRALAPAFGQCLDQGQSLTMNKANIRGTIALNHFRLARALGSGQ